MINQHSGKIVVAVLAVGLSSCGQRDVAGEHQVLLTCPAPDNAHVAEFFRDFGGGAAGWQTEGVLVRNVATSTATTVLKLNHGYDVALSWTSPLNLVIYYPDSARVDHWQSEFDFQLTGTDLVTWNNDLIKLPSKDGSFLSQKSECGTPLPAEPSGDGH